MRSPRPVLAVVVLATIALAGTAGAATKRTSQAAATTVAPAPAPPAVTRVTPTHFGVGVQATIDSKTLLGWLPRTGAPIDYSYRYLGGGVNTGAGKNWTDWAPNATYPINYVNEAGLKGYTSVFTYYNLLATLGTCPTTCGEAQQDLTNLNDPAVMNLYFADFAKLMQRLGTGTYDGVAGADKDAIVHVEPDLSGYAETATNTAAKCYTFCSGVGNDPSLLRASVASSGFPLAAQSANTYRGFNQVLIKIRDTYAPKVRLGMHVSNWATGTDLNSATATTIDPVALGNKAGAFAAASGATWTDGTTSTYDLIFNDVSNKDAGYYTYVLNKPRYWDQDNAVFPNFHRWEAYVKAVTTTTQRKAIVWQVPIGNQLYESMNNTPGHWQDNRVEYFFGHVAELRDAGLVGMLFGSTISDSSDYWDADADGVTNPAATCNSDGWSSGKVVCNTVDTPVADDDGGYLRVSIQNYYKNPLAL